MSARRQLPHRKMPQWGTKNFGCRQGLWRFSKASKTPLEPSTPENDTTPIVSRETSVQTLSVRHREIQKIVDMPDEEVSFLNPIMLDHLESVKEGGKAFLRRLIGLYAEMVASIA